MSFVVDASALVFDVYAPHLVEAEFGNVLRRHVRRGDMTADHAALVLQQASVAY